MAIYRLHRQQWIPASVQDVWAFFSDAKNLEAITPAKMKFRVTSGTLPQQIYPGQIITYRVSPLLGRKAGFLWMSSAGAHIRCGIISIILKKKTAAY
jgi:ligand-binding SRPBCC domain-containing protein